MKTYRELEIYKLSYRLAVEVHKLSLQLPKFELYEEASQARRSSKAVTALIVEGYGRSKYKAEFLKFLIYALGSCDETTVHLNFLKDTHDDFGERLNSLLKEYDELGKKVNKFIGYVESNWNNQYITSNEQPLTSN